MFDARYIQWSFLDGKLRKSTSAATWLLYSSIDLRFLPLSPHAGSSLGQLLLWMDGRGHRLSVLEKGDFCQRKRRNQIHTIRIKIIVK